MTALLSPSMPMQMAPERLTFAFSMRTTRRPGFFSLALIAAIGPPVPPPMTSRSVSTVSVLLPFTLIRVARQEELLKQQRLQLSRKRHRTWLAAEDRPAAEDKARDRCPGRAR